MRVVHVISGLTTGGAETVLYRLTTYRTDVEHEVVCLQGRGTYSDRLEAKGIAVHHLNGTGASPATWLRLRNLIKKSGADVVQSWMYRSNILAGIAAKSAGIPVVWNIRGASVEPLRRGTRLLARVGGALARWVPSRIVNCSATSVELHARLGYDPRQVVTIPNGYDPADFRPDQEKREATRFELGIGPDSFLIGSFGRWETEKGYGVLLPALALLRQKGIELPLLLVGPGLDSTNAELKKLIDENGCGDLVRTLGEVREVPAIARAIDLHVLPSLTEGFPNVVAETMLSGTPNVATDVGDSKLIVGETGWVVPAGDPEQLAAAIEKAHTEWSDAPKSWRERQAAARERIADNFSLERMVAGYELVWRMAARCTAPDLGRAGGLRVLHVINSLTLGGAESLLYRLSTRDPLNEHVVVSLGAPGWYSERLAESGIEVHHLHIDSSLSFPKGVARLKKLMRDSGADVVQCWMYRSNVLGGLLAKSAGKPVVWGIHSASFEPLRPSSRAMARLGGVLASSTPDFIINCSKRSAELHEKLGYSAADGAVVHNGYNASIWFPDEAGRSAAREALGLAAGDFAIGTVSRWDPIKDIPNLLAALRIVKDRGVPFRCFFVGAGLDSENSKFMTAVARTGCGDLVVPLGSRSDVQQLARAFDLHVLASRTEAFPNVVAETMLSGTPNVVTDVGDAALMVGESGWIVPTRDPQRLADAIAEAYRERKDKPKAWEARRRAARKQIEDNFSFDQMVEGYQEVWRKVAARRPRQSSLKPTAVQ